MSFVDLEKRIEKIKSVPYKEVCIWYKVLNNPQSSTKYHVHKDHNLYPCYANCSGLEKFKACYRPLDVCRLYYEKKR